MIRCIEGIPPATNRLLSFAIIMSEMGKQISFSFKAHTVSARAERGSGLEPELEQQWREANRGKVGLVGLGWLGWSWRTRKLESRGKNISESYLN